MKRKRVRKGAVLLAGVLTVTALLYPDMAWGDGKGAGEDSFLVHAEETETLVREEEVLEVLESISADKSEGTHSMRELTLDSEAASAAIPVKVNISGSVLFWVNLKNEAGIFGGSVQYALFEDRECTKKITLSRSGKAKTKCQADSVAVIEPGEYYLKVGLSKGAKLAQEKLVLEAGGISIPGQAELVSGEWRGLASVRTNKKVYYKLDVMESSRIKIQVDNLEKTGKAFLCNADKKVVSDETVLSKDNTKLTYTVGKGTYYLCVNTEAPYVRAKLSISPVEKSGGNSRKKAELLKVGRAARKSSFLITEPENKAQWYYFKNTGENRIEVHFKGEVQGGELVLEFFRGKTSFGTVSLTEDSQDASFSPTSGVMGTQTLPKGTYQMQVKKKGQKAGGTYRLQVKKG